MGALSLLVHGEISLYMKINSCGLDWQIRERQGEMSHEQRQLSIVVAQRKAKIANQIRDFHI